MLREKRGDKARILIHVQSEELHVRPVLVFLDQFLQARQLLAAKLSPRRPEVQECHLALQGLYTPGCRSNPQARTPPRARSHLPSEALLTAPDHSRADHTTSSSLLLFR